ncbi:hypothetical protein T05_8761 [Trichinella murrelli]|uniref:Uncharacterized protein n=1 Tax=Trichinella murrelli TaxID=144512 RepID=A0A0V0TN43_9BILA|nr:hypothetical protein T05_8761 [Trichinella murrelli]
MCLIKQYTIADNLHRIATIDIVRENQLIKKIVSQPLRAQLPSIFLPDEEVSFLLQNEQNYLCMGGVVSLQRKTLPYVDLFHRKEFVSLHIPTVKGHKNRHQL